jgi:hypothetical protein
MILGSKKLAEDLLPIDGTWVNKGCSAIKTAVAAVHGETFERFTYLQCCPSLFQQRIIGFDVRLHVIGDDIFAQRISSMSVDYRFPGLNEQINYEAIDVPEAVRAACITYCLHCGLLFAGFDFKVCSSTHRWYVLECNPMPGYDMYDRHLNGLISRALSGLLVNSGKLEAHTLLIRSFIDTNRLHQVNPLAKHGYTRGSPKAENERSVNKGSNDDDGQAKRVP